MHIHLVALAWIYVVLMMALAEALSPQGTLLGAFFTFVLYGVLPLSIVLYILGTPLRRRARRRREDSAAQADGGSHAAGDAVAPVGEETLPVLDRAPSAAEDPHKP
jgi:membrane protein implicated in regulation of membrane protease activity